MAIKPHPACAIWPKMTDEELVALAEDIRARGLIHPVTLYAGEMLDGKNRERACEIAGVELCTVVYEGDDPVGESLSLNKNRRHLTKAELGFIVLELAPLKHGGDRKSGSRASEKTLIELGARVGLGRSNMQSTLTVKKHGEPNVIEMVKTGEVGVQAAGAFAHNTPREGQRTATVETVKRIGGKLRHGHPKTMGDRVRAYNEATGFKIMSITVRKAKPIGRMPDDTRQKIEGHIAEIKNRQFKLEVLLEYADQMSEPLRHVFADELRDLRGKFDKLAHIALGGSDLRKIDRPLCHVEIPLRKDDEPAA
jgi:ParB-like chromosome segregation protein Spo0J